MEMEKTFEDLGTDAIVGTKLMNLLGISSDDFIDGARFNQFKDLISYFKQNPDMTYIVNKLTIGKPVDKLNHIWGYVELNKQKEEQDKKIFALQAIDDKNQFSDQLKESKKLNLQIHEYEK